MSELSWSKEAPVIPGWYGVRSLYLNGIIDVFVRPGHSYLCIMNPACCEHTKRDFLMVDKFPDIEWCGPINLPN